ncbi:hypothetical protein K437DRAFT_259000 [Tilletiaria anomala UBC 951]|uniref:Cyclase n=1 Tax=Tilletiaria anomala (strain ATCC 24038 / CBS 436.72 / UBC 951) TaxID=1037660 RepID=A0A066VCZ9_TILAU|nr:uncharacterized protein K437DRAFT_259000 [Tilletiaria anomala UBC 951]KDN39627.1 hypothetical protein K437DRAFT_259000 [Tilletiaria anomala UBC 951]
MRQGLQHTFIPSTAPRWKEHRQAVAERHRQRGRNPVNAISAEDTTSDDAQHAPCTDEVLTANTQCSTHWDGLRHVGHTSLNVFYGGVPRAEIHDAAKAHNAHAHTSGVPPQRLHNPNLESPSSPALKLGMQNWATHGISGRGVLLDVWGYLSRKDLDRQRRGHHKVGYRFGPYDPCSTHTITLDDLKETAAAQGVRFRQGDILLIRMGFTTRYYNSKPSERTKWSISNAALHGSGHKFAGIESLHRMAAWLWDQHFAAIASDSPTLESWPPRQGFTSLHEQLLGFFGMPIGEMFDLEALTEHCVKNKRWTFHFVSWPSNLYGGVASPANAAAYF